MSKKYIVPQTEVTLISSQVIMDSISIVRHSGGGGGFNDESEIW